MQALGKALWIKSDGANRIDALCLLELVSKSSLVARTTGCGAVSESSSYEEWRA